MPFSLIRHIQNISVIVVITNKRNDEVSIFTLERTLILKGQLPNKKWDLNRFMVSYNLPLYVLRNDTMFKQKGLSQIKSTLNDLAYIK